MLHLFEINKDRLAFDSESNALHRIDEPSWRILQRYADANGQKPDADVLEALRREIGPEADEIIIEIDNLIADGALFAPAEKVSAGQMYPDKPRFKAMCLHICHDCNLRCRYCFAGTGDFGTGERTMMDLETSRKAVDFLIGASGPRNHLDIDYFGGEPTMNWPVIVDLTDYCEKRSRETGKEIRLTLTTNAVLLDDKKTDFINRHIKNCVLSLDGRPAVHDRMRPDAGGRGSYERVAGPIRRFVEERGDRDYFIRGTYTRHNLDFAEDVMHLASIGYHVSVEPVVAPDGCGYEIRPEDVTAVEREYERLARMMHETRDSRPFSFYHFQIDLEDGPCSYRRLKGCGAGTEYCAVTPNGDIYPCHQFVGNRAFVIGNIHDTPIQIDQAVTAPFRRLLVPEKTDCQDCWARYFCGGGCAANAWYASGKVDGRYETGCALQKKRLECALWLKAQSGSFEADC